MVPIISKASQPKVSVDSIHMGQHDSSFWVLYCQRLGVFSLVGKMWVPCELNPGTMWAKYVPCVMSMGTHMFPTPSPPRNPTHTHNYGPAPFRSATWFTSSRFRADERAARQPYSAVSSLFQLGYGLAKGKSYYNNSNPLHLQHWLDKTALSAGMGMQSITVGGAHCGLPRFL